MNWNVPLKSGFYYSAEIEWSGRQNAKNVPTRIYVILNRWFSWMHFQAIKVQKISSHEAS